MVKQEIYKINDFSALARRKDQFICAILGATHAGLRHGETNKQTQIRAVGPRTDFHFGRSDAQNNVAVSS